MTKYCISLTLLYFSCLFGGTTSAGLSTRASYRLLPSSEKSPDKVRLEQISTRSRIENVLDKIFGSMERVEESKFVMSLEPSDALEIGLRTANTAIVNTALGIMHAHQDPVDVNICIGMIHEMLVARVREYRILKIFTVLAGAVCGVLADKISKGESDIAGFLDNNLQKIQIGTVGLFGSAFVIFDHLQTNLVFNCLKNQRALLEYPHKTIEISDGVNKSAADVERLAHQVAVHALPKN